MDAETFALRAELERLAYRHSILAAQARRLREFDEAWIATADHVHVSDDGSGSGRKVAVEGTLIDADAVVFVPRSKRLRLTAAGLALHLEWLERETRELLDGGLVGSGNLIGAYEALADARELAHRNFEAVMRLA